MLAAVLSAGAAAGALQSQPPAACAAAMDGWCSVAANCPLQDAATRYALNDTNAHGDRPQWRCYAPSALNAAHSQYVGGTDYCTRDEELRACLAACLSGTPCVNRTPAPPPSPRPAPPNPKPLGNLSAVNVFWPYDRATNGDVYPCTRIPTMILVGNGTLIAMAECRRTIGDGCNPEGGHTVAGRQRDICMKRSADGGATWSALEMVFPGCLQPNPVWEADLGTILINMNCGEVSTARISQSVSSDLGRTWSAPRQIDQDFGGAAGSSVGPGVGLRLSATNPHAPGRLLFIGHVGPYKRDWVWFTDDNGASYSVANGTFTAQNEAQLVELSNGDVMANMRNKHSSPCDCRGTSRSTDGGSTWTDTAYDPTLVDPVCQGSILRVGGAIYFSNPASKTSRTSGLVRRSDDDAQTWARALPVSGPSQGFAYSCLTQVPQPGGLGLLWETECAGCSGPSCCSAFSVLPRDF
eukprot:TRINITY_DN438_c0_g1_i1.p1 TRINITY_DN438_c0_g1~~TRINITY_DN438_c0_g1_i1.p1  ORF type:complete len:499 (+),score=155.31 TRINITY_DN438_c0_g1_i1:99-1499(+)